MIRCILLIVLLFAGAGAKNLEIKNMCSSDIDSFTTYQKEIIRKSYEYGSSYGLGSTLAAIAWQESCAGVYLVNFQDPSAGVFHAYIPNILKKYQNLSDNGFTANMVGQKLINDFEFSAKEAIAELLYWKKIHNGNLENMIKSYNKGFSWEKSSSAASKAENYYSSVNSKSRMIDRYLQKNGVNKIYISSIEPPKLPIYKTQKKDSPKSVKTKQVAKKTPKKSNEKELNELAKFIMVEY